MFIMENKVTNWANPTPAGLVALAVACFCFFALLNGHVDKPGALPLMGCILMGGFFIQIVVAVLDLKSGAIAGGNTFLFFSAYFMLVSGAEMFLKAGGGVDGKIDGWLWLCLGIALILWTPAFFKSPAILTGIVILIDLAIPFIAFSDLTVLKDPVYLQIAGWLLLFAGILGIYLSAAMVVNGTFGKTIFPNPGPLYKEKTNK